MCDIDLTCLDVCCGTHRARGGAGTFGGWPALVAAGRPAHHIGPIPPRTGPAVHALTRKALALVGLYHSPLSLLSTPQTEWGGGNHGSTKPPTHGRARTPGGAGQHLSEQASMSIHQRLAVCQTCLKSASSFTKKLRCANLLGRTSPSQPSQLSWCVAWWQAWRRAWKKRVQPRGVPHLQPASASHSAAAGAHAASGAAADPPATSCAAPCVCARAMQEADAQTQVRQRGQPRRLFLKDGSPAPGAHRFLPRECVVPVAYARGPAFRTSPRALQVRMVLTTIARSTSTPRSRRPRRHPPNRADSPGPQD